MSIRKRAGLRLHRLLIYWNAVKHPYGRDYAKQHYTPTGKARHQRPSRDEPDRYEQLEADYDAVKTP